jgi:hypothetical protein
MSQATAAANCPECGALVRAQDKQCWLCMRLLQWEGNAVKLVGGNRFADAPLAAQAGRYYYKTNIAAVLGVIFAALAMLPAAMIACVITCGVTMGTSEAAAMLVGPISGLVVLIGFLVLIGTLSTRVTKKVAW